MYNTAVPGIEIIKITPQLISFEERREGKEKERERNIDVRDKYRSVASCTQPDQGPNPKPSHVH